MKNRMIAAGFGLCLPMVAIPASAQTLNDVQGRGYVQCGVHTGLFGFAEIGDDGEWHGFDVDYCRAIASAIFNDADAVRFTPLNATERFTALQSGEIDVLIRITTWTMTRDASLGLIFAGVNYYDGQSFLVPTELELTDAAGLDGGTVCVQTGTTTELNLADYFNSRGLTFEAVAFAERAEAVSAFEAGRCDAFTADASNLYSTRMTMVDPDAYVVLDERISKEPLGPAVRQDDIQWFNIVKWVHFALLNAEEFGITQANVAEMAESTNPEIMRLLGRDGTFGEMVGLSNDWAYNVIANVGNYGEIFDRNIGAGSPLGIERGLNALWTDGGIHYAPPVR
ncbi:MAG: amino acid ABC transporter substrate-binding protein [Bauldia sp.]|nr:amino acid ABC transporter substrate-binding protein [Bauldia sp.]